MATPDAALSRPANVSRLSAVVEKAREQVARDPGDELWIKLRLAQAIVSLGEGRLDACREIADGTANLISAQDFPGLSFRLRSVEAAAFLASGMKAESLQAFERLLASDTRGVKSTFLTRARINYAAALAANGKSHAASDEYENVMKSAIQAGEEVAAIHVGNNLVSLLKDEGEIAHAERVVTLLEPLLAKRPKLFGTYSLRVHALEILRNQGAITEAATKLRAVLAEPGLPELIQASAHRNLALCEIELERPDIALDHARQSVSLSKRPLELSKSQLALAEVLIAKGDLDEAVQVLAAVGLKEGPADQLKQLHRLRLRALLAKEGRSEELEELEKFEQEYDRFVQQRSRTRRDYDRARLAAWEQASQAREARTREKLAAESRRIERRYQAIVTILLLVGTVVICVAIVMYVRRRTEQLLLSKEREQSQSLATLVEERTAELRETLSTQAETVMKLERKRRLEAIGSLAGNVAHDINNLFQVIRTSNELIKRDLEEHSVAGEMLEISNQSLGQGAAMVEKLLAYSGKQPVKKESIRFDRYLTRIAPLVASLVGEKADVSIANDCPRLTVETDESQLTSTILNMVKNSLEAMPEYGSIALSAYGCEIDEMDASTEGGLDVGSYLRLVISDTGRGMEPEQVERAFEPFYSSKNQNTGLGLSSAYGFIKQIGGDIRIVTTGTQGTVIETFIPAIRPGSAPENGRIDNGQASGLVRMKGARLLLVDDNDSVARTLTSLFMHLGLNVTRASSAQEAIEILENESEYDFVLSDVSMPGELDGQELAIWIEDRLPELPVMLMTGYRQDAERQLRTPTISKPFGMKKFAEAVEKHFPELWPESA